MNPNQMSDAQISLLKTLTAMRLIALMTHKNAIAKIIEANIETAKAHAGASHDM